MKTLRDLVLDELANIYDAEQRIIKALPKLAKACSSPGLKEVFMTHLKQSEIHSAKVQQIFACFDEKPRTAKCEATQGLIQQAEQVAAEFRGAPAVDAALIAAVQKVEHFEVASYGCLQEWAEILGNPRAVGLLQDILEEEKGANQALTQLARAGTNRDALGGAPGTGRERAASV